MASTGPPARRHQASGPEPDMLQLGKEFSKKKPKSRTEKEGGKPLILRNTRSHSWGSHRRVTEPQPGAGLTTRGPPKGHHPAQRSRIRMRGVRDSWCVPVWAPRLSWVTRTEAQEGDRPRKHVVRG